jgi:hypothetical protein
MGAIEVKVAQIGRINKFKTSEYGKSIHRGMSTFDEVVKAYESITPVRTKDTGLRMQDRRPLNARWKWWERIYKFDDNTYGLCDGHEWWWGGKEELKQTCPILWERRADGEYITIRNHYHKFQTSWTRFEFLTWYLPVGISFWYNAGKHFINHEDKDYALPKMVSNVKWGSSGTIEVLQDHKIIFKREGNNFTRVNNLLPVPTKRKGELAYQYQDKILKFWEWTNVMLPVLGDSLTHEGLDVYSDLMTNGKTSIWYWHQSTNSKEVLDILDDEEHPKKMALAVCIAYATESIGTGRHYQVGDKSRQKFIEMMRKVGNMYDVDYK